jgi:hypothetical protein
MHVYFMLCYADITKHPLPLIMMSVFVSIWILLSWKVSKSGPSVDKVSVAPTPMAAIIPTAREGHSDFDDIQTDSDFTCENECPELRCLQRSTYDFRVSTQAPEVFFMNEIAKIELPKSLASTDSSTYWGLLSDPRVWIVVRQRLFSNILSFHPVLSIYYHNSKDYFTTVQRLGYELSL